MKNRKFYIMLVILAATLLLSGCIKMRVDVEVNPDETGTIAVGVGMTQEFFEFSGETSEEAMEDMKDEIALADEEDVEVESFTEGDYEWVQAIVEFEDLDELEDLVEEMEMFENFSLTTSGGALGTTYDFEGEFLPLTEFMGNESGEDMGDMGDFGMDMGDIFDMEFRMTLPGAVQDTNGEEQDDGSITWELTGDDDLEIFATTSKSILGGLTGGANIGYILGGALLLLCCGGIVVIVAVVLILRARKKKAEGEVIVASE